MTLNKKLPSLTLALLSLIPLCAIAQQASQEMARVISSTPITQQVALPQQVCTNSQEMVQRPKSGAGAAMGAIAGGAIGSQIGGGAGKALAIGAGIIGGAIFGDEIEGQPAPYPQSVTRCSQQVRYENRVVAYRVVYEYAGRTYSMQTTTAPGEWIPIQVAPVSASQATPVAEPQAPESFTQPVIMAYPEVVYGPAPRYVDSGVSVRYGWSGWGGHHWR